MKHNRRMSTMILVLVLMITVVLSACSSKNASEGKAHSSNSEGDSKKRIEVEVMKQGTGVTLPAAAEDFVKVGLDEAVNIDLKMSLSNSLSEFSQQLNIRAAGDDLPDIMEFKDNKSLFLEYARKGLLLDLSPYIEKMPEVNKLYGKDIFERGKVDGTVYAFSKEASVNQTIYWIRKDWLDNLGLDVPKNLDELYAAAVAFTNDDPDKNGNKDTFGITGTPQLAFGPLFNLHGVPGVEDFYYVKDEKFANSIYAEEWKTTLAYIQKLIKAGVVDPELSSNTAWSQAADKAFQGKMGIMGSTWGNLMKDQQIATWKGVNPEAEWIMLDELEGPGGKAHDYRSVLANDGLTAISKKVGEDPEKLNRILELFNYISRDTGLDLIQYGVKGEHFDFVDEKVEMLVSNDVVNYTWVYQIIGRPVSTYYPNKFPNQVDYINHTLTMDTIAVYNDHLEYPDGYNPADANRYIEEEMLKFYYDKRPLSEYGEFLETLETTFKYKEFNEYALKTLEEKVEKE